MHRLILSIAFAPLLVLPSSAQDAGKVKLEWKFKKGDLHRYEISTILAVDVPKTPISQETLLGLSFEVVDVDADGTGTLKGTFDLVRFKMTFRMDEVDFDSSRDRKQADETIAFRVLRSFVGKSITMTMSRKGEIQKVEGVDELLAGALKEFPAGAEKMTGALKKSLSDDRAKGLMQTSLSCFPADPVGPGESWEGSASLSMGMLGKADMKSKGTLRELRDNGAEAVIDVETRMGLKVGESGWPMPGIELLEGKMPTEMIWRVDQGILQSSKGELKFELALSKNSPLISASVKQEMKLAPRKKPEPPKDAK